MGAYKDIVVVNEHDEVIGAMPLFAAIEQNMYRRSVRVFVENAVGQLLIQRRGAQVIAPLLLDVSVAGHVDEGETYEEAALRELKEELSISGLPLRVIILSYQSHQYFSGVFKVVISDDVSCTPNQDEVTSVHWYYPAEIDTAVTTAPADFTFEFVNLWQNLRDKIITS
jgi:16S rRNA (adenine1518-N6/adenine1519-N6)-dimethyltransferase